MSLSFKTCSNEDLCHCPMNVKLSELDYMLIYQELIMVVGKCQSKLKVGIKRKIIQSPLLSGVTV